ncbi:type IV toxin-antitoxin system AbiEi family antitoxin domain-containing protein [Microbacterium sp. YY-01]|uniref:type IV toxin-antitoxin system AbiEi family antitoxin domain-containing protein n=1 Tax=Microbacterium sp. YY-01 TaxID=3421634 RepID=UPI003D172509
MNEVLTYLERLREIALDQHGFVTTAQAFDEGIPRVELPKMAKRGRIERVSQGIYRVPQVPSTGHDNLALAVLWAGIDEACLSHDTALAAWGVSDINPNRIHLTIPHSHRVRRAGGDRYVIHRRDLEPDERTWWEGIPITRLPVTIEDCIESGVPTYLVRQALERGAGTSRLPDAARDRLVAMLDARDAEGQRS